MFRIALLALAAVGLGGCVVAPIDGYAYQGAYYAAPPAYYAPPPAYYRPPPPRYYGPPGYWHRGWR